MELIAREPNYLQASARVPKIHFVEGVKVPAGKAVICRNIYNQHKELVYPVLPEEGLLLIYVNYGDRPQIRLDVMHFIGFGGPLSSKSPAVLFYIATH